MLFGKTQILQFCLSTTILIMKLSPIFIIISILSYLLIFFNGEMISIPMFFYLPIAAINFNSPLQALTAALGLLGLLYLLTLAIRTNKNGRFLNHLIIFVLLLSPIIQRLISVPIQLFNYSMFIIPCLSFVIFYLAFLFTIPKI